MTIIADPNRWLVVHNCVNIGLANCLKMQAPGIEIESTDIGRYRRESDAWESRLPAFGRIFTTPELASERFAEFASNGRVGCFPIIHFDAYHPDQCYLTNANGFIKGPLGDYHSQIIVAAHAKGIGRAKVRGLFAPERLAAFGYFDRWDAARCRLLDGFRLAGVPVDDQYPSWSSRGAFMHTINHPAIHVLHDIAGALLRSVGIEPRQVPALPHDNLLNGPQFPIYPGIADHLGVRGCYRFKLPAQYRCLELDEFIADSYDFLDSLPRGEAAVYVDQKASYHKVLAEI